MLIIHTAPIFRSNEVRLIESFDRFGWLWAQSTDTTLPGWTKLAQNFGKKLVVSFQNSVKADFVLSLFWRHKGQNTTKTISLSVSWIGIQKMNRFGNTGLINVDTDFKPWY